MRGSPSAGSRTCCRACATTKHEAHVHPKHPEAWPGSANPQRSYTLLNHESPEFVRFVNPGEDFTPELPKAEMEKAPARGVSPTSL